MADKPVLLIHYTTRMTDKAATLWRTFFVASSSYRLCVLMHAADRGRRDACVPRRRRGGGAAPA